MKYKVGDKVRVKENIKAKQYKDGYTIVPVMTEFAGKVVTIAGYFRAGKYEIRENDENWSWDYARCFENSYNPKKKPSKKKPEKKAIPNLYGYGTNDGELLLGTYDECVYGAKELAEDGEEVFIYELELVAKVKPVQVEKVK